ncbi:malate dehydrogenase (NAD) [Hymenobacter roseosalivarius DSM 11622]|uniref:Malate dehydrogenase (NAD) n=1 Tax=Hymenobacter roseosalivarius DSM 11622 TaxID=645990 RepID=A0A1W1VTJ1_9BACT|nr:Ldh family oxidoreductase [Hymenobacter roseosalivarius]SMB96421.1 malate dehydrogenase (NAD) [Hymenobacter roseosalivarius DSM 11622]
MTFSYNHLFTFTEAIFRSIGCPEADAVQATEALLAADLRGIDSHGVARLIGYVRLWEAGRINPTPRVGVVYETPSTAVVDGDGGLGLVVAPKAMQVATEKARLAGTGWVSVKNSNHFGIAGYHAMKALAHDMIGIAMTNASPLVAPTHSLDRLLGTNPIAVAIPAGEQPDFVADFATTTAANGKLEMLQRKQQPAPAGWIQDAQGHSSTNPNELKDGGALLPLGGETGSHKGYCLGSVVDIFSAVLSGANYGPWVPPFVAFLQPPADSVGQGIGHFFGAMRVDAFRPAAEFKAHMDNWISTFRQARAVDGQQVLIPGDPEREMAAERLLGGIPLLEIVVQDLETVGRKFGVQL